MICPVVCRVTVPEIVSALSVPIGPLSRGGSAFPEHIAQDPRRRVPHDRLATSRDPDPAFPGQCRCSMAHIVHQRAPGGAADDAGGLAGTDGSTVVAAAEQREDGGVDAQVPGRGARLEPPRTTSFSEGDFGVVNAAPRLLKLTRV